MNLLFLLLLNLSAFMPIRKSVAEPPPMALKPWYAIFPHLNT